MSEQSRTERSKWYEEGYERGWNIASWQDCPEIGERLDRFEAREVGFDVVESEDEANDVWLYRCHESEDNGRQFSPFEFTAHEINSLDDGEDGEEESVSSEAAWEDFEEGISDGISAYWQKHYAGRVSTVEPEEVEEEEEDEASA